MAGSRRLRTSSIVGFSIIYLFIGSATLLGQYQKAGLTSEGFLLELRRGFLFMAPSSSLNQPAFSASALLASAIGVALLAAFRGAPPVARILKNAAALAAMLVLPVFRGLGSDPVDALITSIIAQGSFLVPVFGWFGIFCLFRWSLEKRAAGKADRKTAALKKRNEANSTNLIARFKAAVDKGDVSDVCAVLEKSDAAPEGAGLERSYVQDRLLEALRRGNMPVAEILVARGSGFSAQGSKGATVSTFLLGEGRYDDLVSLIYKTPDPDRAIQYAVRAAIKMEKYDFIERLLMKDAKLAEYSDDDGKTFLMAAAEAGDLGLVRSLIAKGAPVDARDGKGESALALCRDYGEGGDIAMLLLESGASPKASDRYGYTPLMEAVKHERVELAKALLAKGADVASRDDKGWSALHIAAIKSRPGMTALLLAAGADPEATDQDGHTPLMYAAATGCLESVRLLAERGDNLDARNKAGKTASRLAAEKGREDVVDLLLKNGATSEADLEGRRSRNDEAETIERIIASKGDGKESLLRLVREAYAWGASNGFPVGAQYPQYDAVRAIGKIHYRRAGMLGLRALMEFIQSDGSDRYTILDLLWNHLRDDNGEEVWLM